MSKFHLYLFTGPDQNIARHGPVKTGDVVSMSLAEHLYLTKSPSEELHTLDLTRDNELHLRAGNTDGDNAPVDREVYGPIRLKIEEILEPQPDEIDENEERESTKVESAAGRNATAAQDDKQEVAQGHGQESGKQGDSKGTAEKVAPKPHAPAPVATKGNFPHKPAAKGNGGKGR